MKAIKKPIVIDAWKLDVHKIKSAPEWVQSAIQNQRLMYRERGEYWVILSIEGSMFCGNDDSYLIQGAKGELYPCRADVFEETYSIVE